MIRTEEDILNSFCYQHLKDDALGVEFLMYPDTTLILDGSVRKQYPEAYFLLDDYKDAVHYLETKLFKMRSCNRFYIIMDYHNEREVILEASINSSFYETFTMFGSIITYINDKIDRDDKNIETVKYSQHYEGRLYVIFTSIFDIQLNRTRNKMELSHHHIKCFGFLTALMKVFNLIEDKTIWNDSITLFLNMAVSLAKDPSFENYQFAISTQTKFINNSMTVLSELLNIYQRDQRCYIEDLGAKYMLNDYYHYFAKINDSNVVY